MEVNEVISFLMDLQKKLKHQSQYDYDGQASPRFWAVGDYRRVPAYDGCGDRTSIHLPDAEILIDLAEYEEGVMNGEYDYSEEQVANFKEKVECDISLGEWVKEIYGQLPTFYEESEEHYVRQDTLFLTKEECKQHIERNKHNYNKPHTYAMTALRSPQVEQLWQILEDFDWSNFKEGF